jgi:hypothetical protein
MPRPFRWRVGVAAPDGVRLLHGCPGHRFPSAEALVAWWRTKIPTLRGRGLEVVAIGDRTIPARFFPAEAM